LTDKVDNVQVLFLRNRSAFSAGLESLLQQEVDFQVVSEMDPLKVVECVREMKPSVVIVDSSLSMSRPMLTVMRILNEGLNTRVIVTSLVDNTICVYQGQRRPVNDVKDLLDAIVESDVNKPEGQVMATGDKGAK
jgi:DNA-binding NarL/FixJ family response regulator